MEGEVGAVGGLLTGGDGTCCRQRGSRRHLRESEAGVLGVSLFMTV
jgi:hypothetical protein